MSFQTSALILSWIAILLLALVVSGLVRQVHALSSGMVQRRPESVGLPAGTPAPGFAGLAPVPPAVPLVLLFLDPDCGTCAQVLAEAADRAGRGGLEFRVLYRDDAPARAAGLPVTVLTGQAELFDRYDAVATPFATVVDRSGRVLRAEPLGSRAALRRLLDEFDSPSPGGLGPAVATDRQGGRA
ncbi:TlpA family protein disulfide reductase [Micromonospora echinospora]